LTGSSARPSRRRQHGCSARGPALAQRARAPVAADRRQARHQRAARR